MKNSQKGVSTLATLIIGLIIVVVIAAVVFSVTRTPAKIDENQPGTIATTTPDTTATTTTSTISDDPKNTNLKLYTNTILGFSFSYPRDFTLLNEGFSTSTGSWSATFHSSRGDIIIDSAKTLPGDGTRLENQTITLNNKQASAYNVRRETCDAHVVRTDLDSDYKLQIAFQSCGGQTNAIYGNTDEINAFLNSFTFTNANTRLYVNTKLGEAFRYPTLWNRPTVSSTDSGTLITFGKDLTIKTGVHSIAATSTTNQALTVAGKPAHLLTTTPTSGPKQRTYYIEHAGPTDLVVINQTGVDSEGLDLVISTLTFF